MELRGVGELQTRVQGQHEQSRAVSAGQHGPACAPPRSVSTTSPLQLPLLRPVAALHLLRVSLHGLALQPAAAPGSGVPVWQVLELLCWLIPIGALMFRAL